MVLEALVSSTCGWRRGPVFLSSKRAKRTRVRLKSSLAPHAKTVRAAIASKQQSARPRGQHVLLQRICSKKQRGTDGCL